MQGKLMTFEEMEQLVLDFEQVLKMCHVPISPGSDLEWICLNVINILTLKQQPELQNPLDDIRSYFVDVLGLWSFMTKIVTHRNHSAFANLAGHLALLNKGKVPQNSTSPVTDEASNKIFELLIGLCCLPIGESISLDHPSHSKGDNPDILITVNGTRWGLACKVIHGKNPKTIYDNIETAIRQIENSDAEKGIVVINFKKLIDHSMYWPILNEEAVRDGDEPVYGVYRFPASIPHSLASLVTDKRDEVVRDIGLGCIEDTFKDKKAIPGALVFTQTATTVNSNRGPIPTSIDVFTLADFEPINESDLEICRRINDSLHDLI